MSELTIEVQERQQKGKNANRRLRAAGEVPAVVYGDAKDAVPIRVGSRKIEELLKASGSENAVFLLKLAGTDKSRHTMIRELQLDPITGEMIHIDFQRVNMDQKVRVMVHVELHGEPYGVKTDGGLLDFVTREVEVECLPGDIPHAIELDVAPLHVGQHVEAGQLSLPDGVKLLSEAERVIVSISAKRHDAEGGEGEGEGLISSGAAEPELIGRRTED